MAGISKDARSHGDEETAQPRGRLQFLRAGRVFRPIRLSIIASPNRLAARRKPRARVRAARTLAWFVLFTFIINVSAFLALDVVRPGIRDPEYDRRIRRFEARIAENPGRPAVVCIGSSRTAAGVCPAAWEAARPNTPGHPDPLLLNLGLAGSGPIMELLALRRLLHDGPLPSAILIEYWPPFLHGHGDWNERNRIGLARLSPLDREVVHDYFPDPDVVDSEMRRYEMSPVYANREILLVQSLPEWLRRDRRADGAWLGLDPWGWLPGVDLHAGDREKRALAIAASREKYRSLFEDYRASRDVDRITSEMARLARERGIAVGLMYLPESAEFRSWYSPGAEKMATDHLAEIGRELALPIVNARSWMMDEAFADGYHLTRKGAGEFTRRLGPAARAAFAEVER